MTLFKAKAKAVKVRVGSAGGNTVAHILRAGSVLPAGVAQEEIDGLVERGLVEAVPDEPTATIELAGEGPYAGAPVKDLKSELESRNQGRAEGEKIVPAEPGNRAEIVAALLADDAT